MEGPGNNNDKRSRLAEFLRRGRDAVRGKDSDGVIHLDDRSHLRPDDTPRDRAAPPDVIYLTDESSTDAPDDVPGDVHEPGKRASHKDSLRELLEKIRANKAKEDADQDLSEEVEEHPSNPDMWTEVVRPETSEDLESELEGEQTDSPVSHYLDPEGGRRSAEDFEANAERYRAASADLQRAYDEARERRERVSREDEPKKATAKKTPEKTNKKPKGEGVRATVVESPEEDADEQAETTSEGVSHPDASPHTIRENHRKKSAEAPSEPWRKLDGRRYIGITTMTNDQILRDELGQQFFGSMLHKIAPERADEIMAGMKTGELSAEDRAMIDYARKEHGLFLKQRERVESKIDSGLIHRLAMRDDSLRLLVEERGAEVAAKAMKQQLMKSAIEDPDMFEKFLKSMHTMSVSEKSVFFNRYDKRIHALADDAKITDTDFDKVFNLKDRESRKETFQYLVDRQREDMGHVRKALDSVMSGLEVGIGGVNGTYFPLPKFLRFSSEGKARAWMYEAEKLQNQTQRSIFRPNSFAVSDVRDALNTVASFAHKTLVQDKEARAALTRAAFLEGGKTGISNPEESGPKTIGALEGGMASAKTEDLSEAKVAELWARDRARAPLIDGKGWNDYTPDQREAFRESWVPHEQRRREAEPGKGIFASILRAFIKALFGERRKKLALN